MKLIINLLLISALLIVGAGCVTPPKTSQNYLKSTTVGIVLDWSVNASYPSLKLGIVRDMWFSNPTSTNQLYALPFSSDTKADLNLFHNTATENFTAAKP